MTYSRESLNTAVSLKLKDISSASGMHKGLFALTQSGGIVCAVGAVLCAPLALEVALIAGGAGAALYGVSQLLQSKRLGRFMPLPGVPISAQQLGYLPSVLVAQVMGGEKPEAPEEFAIRAADWLPQRERRINYLLTHCADLLIGAAQNAQEGISFAAIVDTAVRASEYAITDEQINNPVVGHKLAGDVRMLLQGDTSKLEAQQQQAIAAEWKRAQLEHSKGVISDAEFEAVEAEVCMLAPSVVEGTATRLGAVDVAATPADDAIRDDWQEVFGMLKDQNSYPAVVIIGPQGVGKTTLIQYILSTLDRDKIALDPHYECGTWPGCLVIGAGMNYGAISEALANISSDVKERYRQRSTFAGYKPQPVTLVLEEQTNWAGKVDGADKFLKQTLSDIRKVGYQSISVAHGSTNAARGGAVGTAKMREQGEFKIELVEQGLAKISIKGRKSFKLRYPDPKPYTVNRGEPIVAKDGGIKSAAVNRAVNAAAHTQQATARFTAEVTAPQNGWSKFRELSADHPHLVALANWLERKEGQGFTLRQLKKDKTVAQAFKAADADVKAGVLTFQRYGFIYKGDEPETFNVRTDC